uniref:BTB domain-containing protein n=1 Tax=Bracon brevicornis TaxID=1563983 RepID=A0A6V7JGS3_9HYME
MSPQKHRDKTEVKVELYTYEWEIHNFDLLHNNGLAVESSIFQVGNDKVQWKLSLYPNGDGTFDSDGYIGIFLRLVSPGTGPPVIITKCEISMMGRNITFKKDEFTHNYSFSTPQNGWSLFLHRDKCINALKSDRSMLVRCKIDKYTAIETKPVQRTKIFHIHNHRWEDDCRKLWQEPHLYSDVKLLVKNEKLPAHKLFLTIRSPIFAAMFTNENSEESKTNEIKIDDAEPAVVKAMLEFIYTDRVKNLNLYARKLFAIAHKYELERLKNLCEQTLYRSLNAQNAGEILMLAHSYGSLKFVDSIADFICEHFCDVVQSRAHYKIDNAQLLKRLMRSVAMLEL